MADNKRWVCMNSETMVDDSCTCEVWVDQFTGRAYAVTGFPGKGLYIPVTYSAGKIKPISIGENLIASFATPEEARAFLFASVNH